MESECGYNQNKRIGIKLLCGRIRGTCLSEITSRPETAYGTKLCMQSRNRMSETNQCRRSVFSSWNCATGEMYVLEWRRPNRNPMRPTLYMDNTMQREGFLRSVKPAEFSLRSYGVMIGLGDYKQHHTKLLST